MKSRIGGVVTVATAAVAGFAKVAGDLNKAYMVQASAEELAQAAGKEPYLSTGNQ